MKNWMKNIPDDVKITGITIPGTHDSTACYVDFSFISKTQKLTVSEQLNAGVRYFDFRFKHTDGKFVANHSIAHCRKKQGFWNTVLTAEDVVNDCVEFVKNNPSETVLFQLKEAQSHTGYGFYNEFYEKYIKTNSDVWFIENKIPVLGEARGKIVLLRVVEADITKFTDENCGIDFTSYPYIGSTETDDWRRGDIKTLGGNVYSHLFVQDSYKVEGQKKWATVTRFLESGLSEDEFNICLTSCIRIFVPRFNAGYINPKILSFFFKKSCYGIIAVDYADVSLCRKIIETNF